MKVNKTLALFCIAKLSFLLILGLKHIFVWLVNLPEATHISKKVYIWSRTSAFVIKRSRIRCPRIHPDSKVLKNSCYKGKKHFQYKHFQSKIQIISVWWTGKGWADRDCSFLPQALKAMGKICHTFSCSLSSEDSAGKREKSTRRKMTEFNQWIFFFFFYSWKSNKYF